MKLIDADALKSDIAKLKESPWFNTKAGYAYRKEAIITVEILCVDKAPTVDTVRHGEWIDLQGGKVYCTECGEQFDWRTNYCPECGALMGDLEYEGTWKKLECGGYECTECGEVVERKTKFCPECGSDKRWRKK